MGARTVECGTPGRGRRASAARRPGAGVLFRDDTGRVLLVKPTYKDGWEIPGGYVEKGESPRAAAIREVSEELGAHLDVTDLLVSDWAPHPAEGDKLLFIFRGGTLAQEDLDRFDLDHRELSEAQFFRVEELAGLMPERLARRVSHAARHDTATYLEHDRPVPTRHSK
nr:NUDIX hydrolase [uncultured Cellulomonas sp.]